MFIHSFLAIAASIATASSSPSRNGEILPLRPARNGPSSSTDAAAWRIMVVGDSITHGHEADYTWRYRLWEWLRDSGTAFSFVGPYTGTCAPMPVHPPKPPRLLSDPVPGPDSVDEFPRIEWGYAKDVSRDFDAHHFATSGHRADRLKFLVQDRVLEYKPNMLLILLGFNDLSWGGASPEDLLKSHKTLIDAARTANPTLKIAIGNVVHEAYSGPDLEARTVTYNELLRSTHASWSNAESPLHYTDVAGVYTCGPGRNCTSTADGLHPNMLGAYQIAHAFSKTLIDHFSIGQHPVQIPSTWTEREVDPPTNIKAASTSMGIQLTWDRPFGITDFHVRRRTGNEDWIIEYGVQANRSDTILTHAGITYEYQIRSCMGRRCGAWSSEHVSAVSDRRTGPPPEDVRTKATHLGFHVSWSPPKDGDQWNITQYSVAFYNRGTMVDLHVGTREHSATLEGMPSGEMSVVGKVIEVRVSAWTEPEGGSVFAPGRPVLPGAMHPPQKPMHLKSQAINETFAYLKWVASEYAAGCLVYVNGHTDGIAVFETEKVVKVDTSVKTGQLLDICVSEINGESESAQSCLSGRSNPSSSWYPESFTATLAWFVAFCVLVALVIFMSGTKHFIKDRLRGVYMQVPLA